MQGNLRTASLEDVDAMVALSERERSEREKMEPEFFRKAERGGEAQAAYFKWQLAQRQVIALVHETPNGIDGFAIATLVTAPPVYAPGGQTALIDDFTVGDPRLWDSVGTSLFEAIHEEARKRGAVGIVSICAHKDEAKRQFLSRHGLRIVSEWHFSPIESSRG
jgi:GNAT superfamily N-acetyltransferase